jgi:hydroxymethylglutaryl-CoA lyase
MNCVRQLQAMGCYEISLGDTTGVGVATDVVRLIEYLKDRGIPPTVLAGHFHDTYGQAVSNVWAAYHAGVQVFDASVAGLGGCPYAPGAKGNLATEDLVYSFEQAGIETGVNLNDLVKVGAWISQELNMESSSRAGKALATPKKRSAPFAPRARPSPSPEAASSVIHWEPHLSYDGLEILRAGVNVKIVLNRPENGNALTTPMISNLTNFMEAAASDASITRIVITARGKFFCTGMDLAKDSSPVGRGAAASDAQYERLTRLFASIDKAPQVTIACIQGPAFGGGIGLAFACDIRIAAETAGFTLSEVKLGLAPATISKYVVREWNPAFSREAMLSARKVSAAELVRLGKISQVVKTEAELPGALDRYLAGLSSSAPNASAMSKELVNLGCLDGADDSRQAVGVKNLFGKMMSENRESAFGLAQFQAGRRPVDWDAFTLERAKPKPKL